MLRFKLRSLYDISLYGLWYVCVKERDEQFVVFRWTNTCIFCIVDTFVRMLWLLELWWKRSCKKSVLLKTWYFSLNNTSVVFLFFFNTQLNSEKVIWSMLNVRWKNVYKKTEKIFFKWHLQQQQKSWST